MTSGNLVDIFDPALVAATGVGGQTNQLDTSLRELGLQLSESAEFGGADRSEIFGVGEEDNPAIANELVEVDGTFGGLGLEVRSDGAQAETTLSGEFGVQFTQVRHKT